MTPNVAVPPGESLQRRVLELRLQRLLRKGSDLRFACLGTVDGRMWAFASQQDGSAPQRLSAITSSLLGLCETFAREAQLDRCLYNLIAAEDGVLVTVRVPCASRRFALSLAAGPGETVAMALRLALDGAKELAGLLDGDATTPSPSLSSI